MRFNLAREPGLGLGVSPISLAALTGQRLTKTIDGERVVLHLAFAVYI